MRLKYPDSKTILIIILIIGAFLRFYKLDWGEGLFTHPDEYHITSSVEQLSFPSQMNPHFFNYGTVVIYLIYFTKLLLNFLSTITNYQLPINSFLIGRFYSALFSTLTIILVYKICSLLFEKKWALVASLLTALMPGLIQQAHFATPESLLTFFLFSSLYFLLRFINSEKTDDTFFSSVSLGLALGVKVISVLFAPILAIGIIFKLLRKPKQLLLLLPLNFLYVVSIFYLVAPFVFLDFKSWASSTQYEGNLAMGKLPVFYTRQFINTIPFIFQAVKILPVSLGPVVEIFAILGFMFILMNFLKKPTSKVFLIIATFLVLFVSNGLLFAKWTRFIAPTFPFFAIFAVYFLNKIKNFNKRLSEILLITTVVSTVIWTMAFFSIYINPDIRITASSWLEQNIPAASTLLVEGGNMVDIPLSGNYKKISLDFYNLETDPLVRQQIVDGLLTSDYFLIESRRVFLNHMRLPESFPKTAHFYNALFSGNLGFQQIKEIHSYPSLGFLGLSIEFPDEQAEETWSVFDHPVIRVFQKKVNLSKEEYAKIVED